MTHASLFSGIGGPEVAAYILGWENLFHCDINEFSRKVLDFWFPKSESYEDVKRQDFTKWRGFVDVLTGGFPCQPFSLAGQRKGTEDDRYLWPQFKRVITEIRPRWVIGENVAGIASMVQSREESVVASQTDLFGETTERVEVVERFVINTILEDLESIGYTVQPIVIPACAVGAPHRRDRVFFLGRRNDDTSYRRKTIRGSGESGQEYGEERTTEYASIGRFKMPHDTPRPTQNEQRVVEDDGANAITDTESEQGPRPRQREVSQEEQGQSRRGHRQHRLQGQIAADGYGVSRKAGDDERHEVWEVAKNGIESLCRKRDCWEQFPTQSPICGGDDGFPVPLDSLTVPFPQWRSDAIRAYGNAIVPQIMIELFRAIEQVEQETPPNG